MGSTTPYGLRWPEPSAGANGPQALRNLAEDVAPRLHRAEPLTPAQITAIASPRIGQLVLNTDTGRVQFWNGTAWRAVGGGASGSSVLGAVVIPANNATTWLTLSVFLGLGFDEVTFMIASSVIGAGIYGPGAQFTASADASRAFGISVAGNTTTAPVMFAATNSSDFVPVPVSPSSGGSAQIETRNIRIDADGYLRFEMRNQTSATVTASTNFRVTWRAR
ncbi:hypothetical protein [Kineococcus terrestris]|uniref:hypothetical protein n=1 Tax=Kineococcus terrestris TaxID=2044856 RepID=UPI0034DB0103